MMSKEQIIASLTPLVPSLTETDPQWAVFGSAALVLCGMETEAADIDIMLTRQSAQQLEEQWAQSGMPLMAMHGSSPGSPFRSHLLRLQSSGILVELSGGLEMRQNGRWEPVEALDVQTAPGGIRYCSLSECKRLLQMFGRPKDLLRLREIEAYTSAEP